MYFREKIIKGSKLLQLVESYRNDEGLPRQRIVASLGGADIPEESRRRIARQVELRLHGQTELFDVGLTPDEAGWVDRVSKLAERKLRSLGGASEPPRSSAPAPELFDGVLADRVESSEVTGFGPELIGMAAWDALGLGAKLLEMGLTQQSAALAQAMVINRLIHPLSEWALIDWLEGSSLPECLGARVSRTTKDRLYKTSDDLFSRREALENHLREAGDSLFGGRGSIVLYDLTNTHFEGLCEANPKAERGRNKQKRHDAPQVAIGLAFDERGRALAHEVFDGNISDAKTLVEIVERLGSGLGGEKGLIVLDAGFATKDNLKMLRERGYSYLINATRGSRAKYAAEFSRDGFKTVPGRDGKEPVEVMAIDCPETPGDRLVLCRSQARRGKELAMLSGAEKKFIEAADKLRTRVADGRLKDKNKINKAIGALAARHKRVSRYYRVSLLEGAIVVESDDKALDEARELCGNYVLRTDLDLSADELWGLYMTLLKAEDGFRMLKGTLGLRPNYHHIEKRIEGHIFISILAYHLLNWINHRLGLAGDTRTWRTLRVLMRTHCLVTTSLPLEDGRIVSIRKPSQPDTRQEQIYRELGIDWRAAYKPRRSIRKA
jgi:transposase